ncbi:hypothetical protein TruAng_008836 [Truncatella angustata]|nr:hypothetical protein TruAng_008836 [Truncatella angustata]
MKMKFDPKYYAEEPPSEPVRAPLLTPKLEALEESKKRFAETQRRLIMLGASATRPTIEGVLKEKKPQQSRTTKARDDDVDMWHHGIRPQPSTTEFTVVSEEDDYEHPVPCGDKECDRCYVFSVVSDFADDDLLPYSDVLASVAPPAPRSGFRGWTEAKMDKTTLKMKGKVPKEPTPRISPRARTKEDFSTSRTICPEIRTYEARQDRHEIQVVKLARIELSKETISEYLKKRSGIRDQSHLQPPSQTQRSQTTRIMSTEHSKIGREIRSPLSELQDKLSCISIASEASLGLATPNNLQIPDNPTIDRLHGRHKYDRPADVSGPNRNDPGEHWYHLQQKSLAGTWATETRRNLHKASDLKSPSSQMQGALRGQTETTSTTRTRSSSVNIPNVTRPLGRNLSFKERVLELQIAPEKSFSRPRRLTRESPGTPRLGKGSRPPLSMSGYCNSQNAGTSDKSAECNMC